MTQLERARREVQRVLRDPFGTPLTELEVVIGLAQNRGTSDRTIPDAVLYALRDFSRAVLAVQDAKRRLIAAGKR